MNQESLSHPDDATSETLDREDHAEKIDDMERPPERDIEGAAGEESTLEKPVERDLEGEAGTGGAEEGEEIGLLSPDIGPGEARELDVQAPPERDPGGFMGPAEARPESLADGEQTARYGKQKFPGEG
jgi:hypothetical protein